MTIRRFLVMAVCLSCLGCRAAAPSSPRDPTTSTAGGAQATSLQAQSADRNTVVYAYYFHRTFRCVSCLSMEEMASRTIEEHFARQLQNGRVIWMPANIEDPATEALRKQLEVQGTGLVLARMEDGVYKDSKSVDRLWGLLSRPDDFSKCVVDEVNAYLSSAQGG